MKQFPFLSELARGSVLIKEIEVDSEVETTSAIQLLTKGAPEVIRRKGDIICFHLNVLFLYKISAYASKLDNL